MTLLIASCSAMTMASVGPRSKRPATHTASMKARPTARKRRSLGNISVSGSLSSAMPKPPPGVAEVRLHRTYTLAKEPLDQKHGTGASGQQAEQPKCPIAHHNRDG